MPDDVTERSIDQIRRHGMPIALLPDFLAWLRDQGVQLHDPKGRNDLALVLGYHGIDYATVQREAAGVMDLWRKAAQEGREKRT